MIVPLNPSVARKLECDKGLAELEECIAIWRYLDPQHPMLPKLESNLKVGYAIRDFYLGIL